MRCCARDEGRPFGTALRREVPNHPELRWLKTVVVSVREKAYLKRQVGTGKTCQKRPAGVTRWGVVVEASKSMGRHRNRGSFLVPRDEPGGRPVYWPGGARRRSGVSLVCCSCMEREKASIDMAAVRLGVLALRS